MKKLLSREPTPEMVRVALDRYWKTHDVADLIRAMWDAAPALPEPGDVERDLRIASTYSCDPDCYGRCKVCPAEIEVKAADLIAALVVAERVAKVEKRLEVEMREKAEAECERLREALKRLVDCDLENVPKYQRAEKNARAILAARKL